MLRNLGVQSKADGWSKVPQATLVFWIIKILATTLGETGGDALSMTLNLGYAVSSLIFLGFSCVTVAGQIASSRYRPAIYWAVVVATTTVGTTTSDYLDRSLRLDAPARGDAGRYPYQAASRGRVGARPHHLFPGNCRRHDHPYRRDLTPQTCGAGLKA
jgi:hypothetical protein